MKIETALIHHGNFEDGSGAVMPPIVLSTTFERAEDGLTYPSGYIYSRYATPNRTALEDKLTLLENGVETITFSSGLAAAMAVFQSLGSGSHVIFPDDVYFGARSILEKIYLHWGLSFSLVDMSDIDKIKEAVQPNTKLIWIESPSNPLLKLTDIQLVVEFAKQKNILTVCDNTWATPFITKPLDLGVDISLHSTTKYLGGHSDVLGGSLTFKKQSSVSEYIRMYQKTGGAVPSPFDCWLLCRSLATFAVRMPVHSNNAMKLAQFLESHPAIEAVMYPGLPTNRFHEIAKKQMKNGFGGMLSILIKGGQEETLRVASKLQLFKHATSLGGVESLIEHRKSIEGASSLSPENLLRISAGIEAIEDLIADFEQALGS